MTTTYGTSRARELRGGFTLVELLVVMVIIGVLAAMITTAVFDALKAVERARHVAELGKLNGAFQSFKEQFSRFPPDGTGGPQVMDRFIRVAFPERKRGAAQKPSDLDPAKSVVYWLSRLSTDPTDRFRQTAGGVSSTSAGKNEDRLNLMAFNNQLLKNGMYYPPNYEPDTDPPFIYFESSGYQKATYKPKTSQGEEQSIRPYDYGQGGPDGSSSSRSGGQGRNYASPESFQLISGGLDKRLGKGGTMYVDSSSGGGGGSSMSRDDEDNHVNFDNRQVKDIR